MEDHPIMNTHEKHDDDKMYEIENWGKRREVGKAQKEKILKALKDAAGYFDPLNLEAVVILYYFL